MLVRVFETRILSRLAHLLLLAPVAPEAQMGLTVVFSEAAMSDTTKKARPERRVIKAGVSLMNPRVKWAQLECGHDVWRQRKPRIGALIECEECAQVKS